MNRRRIHSNVKLLVAAGQLPKEYANTIHRSQLWRYRKMSANDFFGSALQYPESGALEIKLNRYPVLKFMVTLLISILDITRLIRNIGLFRYNQAVSKMNSLLQQLWDLLFAEMSEAESTNEENGMLKDIVRPETDTAQLLLGDSETVETAPIFDTQEIDSG